MRRIKLLITAMLVFGPYSANAVLLDYTGNTFDQLGLFGPTAPADLFTTDDSVSGWLDLVDVLAPNLSGAVVDPLSFLFTDGINTFTEASPLTTAAFQFWTDANGDITQWAVSLQVFAPEAGGGTSNTIQTINRTSGFETTQFDLGSQVLCGPASTEFGCAFFGDPFSNNFGQVQNDPGTWDYRDADVPEPGTLALLGIGLLGMGMRRRRTRI